ncbi:MAG: hypothetical protein RXQ62_06560 [Nitrososphaeria archaeon]
MNPVQYIWYWSPREEDLTRDAIVKAQAKLADAMAKEGQMNYQVRPLVPTDLGASSNNAFINYTGITGAGTFQIASFTSQKSRPLAIFGFRNLNNTATGVITGIQFIINGQQIPLQPVPLTLSWNEETEKTVYFSPVYVTAPNVPVQIQLTAAASASSVSFELVGLVAQPTGATLS